jgi:alkylated DNA repair dioxygenase AlkB
VRQDELFSTDALATAPTVEIPGFRLDLDYVAPEEEVDLIARIESGPWQTGYRRRIQQYGLGYASDRRKPPRWLREFPDWLEPLAGRVAADAPLERFPENCVINEYHPPLGIGSHKDYDTFGPAVACVSLGSDVVMDFDNPETGVRVPVVVPSRSFWVITGDARFKWEHGIANRLTDLIAGERRKRERRISITFRTAREPVATRPMSLI